MTLSLRKAADFLMASAQRSWNSKDTDGTERRWRELETDGRPIGVWALDKGGFTWRTCKWTTREPGPRNPVGGGVSTRTRRPALTGSLPVLTPAESRLGKLLHSTHQRGPRESQWKQDPFPPSMPATWNRSPNSHPQPDVICRAQRGHRARSGCFRRKTDKETDYTGRC